ncbi:MAG TPA: hypothetical protein VG889_02475 [Rhizomicrobium sp.]|nr:hypothetical protein [Rhizomicrobium sp.]
MGAARLLAKGWVVVCLFAGAHALHAVLGGDAPGSVRSVLECVALFAAMGLVFVSGYAAATEHGHARPLEFAQLVPSFDGLVFAAFVILSFANQIVLAPEVMQNPLAEALHAAIAFAIPGQRALEGSLACGLDGGRVFSSSFAWLLAIVYFASAATRLRLTAGLIRLERVNRPEVLGPTTLAFLLGIVAVVGIQLLLVGSAYRFLPCSAYTEITGALLIGLAPLMLAHLIVAALANLLASGPNETP